MEDEEKQEEGSGWRYLTALKEEEIKELRNRHGTVGSGGNHGVQGLPVDMKKSGCIVKPVGIITLTKYKIIKSSEDLNLLTYRKH